MEEFGTAITITVQAAIGMGFIRLGQYFSQRIKWGIGKALLSWPCFVLGFIFLSSAVVTMFWNMFGPIMLWLLSFVFSK